jgi:hypothetical protein
MINYLNNFRFIKKDIFKLTLIALVLLSPFISLADPATSVTIVNPITSATTLTGLIQVVLVGVIKIGIPIIALAIIYCGFLFVAARGNSEKLKKAKDALLYTLIGAAILLGAWAIAQLISNTVLAL